MGIVVGTTSVRVVPSAETFWDDFKRQSGPAAQRMGNAVGDQITKGMGESLAKGAARVEREGKKTGSKFSGAFGKEMERGFRSAFDAIGKIPLQIDDEDVKQSLADIKDEFKEIVKEGKDGKIEIRLDADEALARARQVSERLRAIGESSPEVEVAVNTLAAADQLDRFEQKVTELASRRIDVEVDADAAHAEAQMAAFRREVNQAHGEAIKLNNEMEHLNNKQLSHITREVEKLNDSSTIALGRVGAVGIGIIGLGPAIIPVFAAATAGAIALGTALGGIVAGGGVFGVGLIGIPSALKAMDAAQEATAKSAGQLAVRQQQIANAADGVVAAEQGLASARAQIASVARSNAEGLLRAQEGVINAEYSLQQAQRAGVEAQRALTRARQDAKEAIEDLNASIAGGKLAERQAVLNVERARLAIANENLDLTSLEGREQQLNLEQALFSLEEIRRRNARLAVEQSQTNRVGVEGSDRVVAAKQNIVEANERIAQAERGLTSALREVSTTRIRNAEATVRANQGLENAQRSLTKANRAMETALAKTGTSGAAALDKLEIALGKLSPAGQKFVKFLFSIKPLLQSIRNTAQENMLPGLERGITGFLKYVPAIRNFTGEVATQLGDSFVHIVRQLDNPVWQKFFSMIAGTAVKSMRDWLQIVLNIMEGFAGLSVALQPVSEIFTAWVKKISEGFADLGRAPQQHPGFVQFVKYVKDTTPIVFSVIEDVVQALLRLIVAVEPIGKVVLNAIKNFSLAIKSIPVPILTAVIGAIIATTLATKGMALAQRAFGDHGIVGVFKNLTKLFIVHKAAVDGATTATKAATGAQVAYNASWALNPAGIIIAAILIALAALTAAFIFTWKRSEQFRDTIRDAGDVVRTTFTDMWNTVRSILRSFGDDTGSFGDTVIRVMNWIANGIQRTQHAWMNFWFTIKPILLFIAASIIVVKTAVSDFVDIVKEKLPGAAASLGTISRLFTSIAGAVLSSAGSAGYWAARVKMAADDVRGAEKNLVAQLEDAEQAQVDLNLARKDAVQRLKDLDAQIKSNDLDQRQSLLNMKQAKIDLDTVLADPTATQLQRDQARLTYDQAVFHYSESKRRTADLVAKKAEADRLGIEGDAQVQEARKKVQEEIAKVKQAESQLALARSVEALVQQQRDEAEERRRNSLSGKFRAFVTEVKDKWGAVNKFVSDIYNQNIGKVFSALHTALTLLPVWTALALVKFALIWDKLKRAAGDPVKFVVNTVLGNAGLVGAYNWLASVIPGLGAAKIVPFAVKGFNEGGTVPGTPQPPGMDNMLAQVTGGGLIKVASGEEIISVAKRQKYAPIIDAIQKDNLPGYAGGGVVGGGGAQHFTMPVRGRLTSPYGMRNGRLHDGQDWAAPTGTPIRAAWPGTVYRAGPSGGWGNQVIMAHGMYMGKPLYTRYAHMNTQPAVRPGQNVPSGGYLGPVGSTGRSTGPHLHFGVYRGVPSYGTSIDPRKMFSELAGAYVNGAGGPGGAELSGGLGSRMGNIGKWIKDFGSKYATNKIIGGVAGNLVNKFSSLGTGLIDKFAALSDSFNFGMPGSAEGAWLDHRALGSNVTRWSGLMGQALKELGQNPAALVPGMLRRLKQESGGNPRAINLWDSNARKGIPSKGLMQVIDPTFNAHAGRYRSRGIWDPLANIYAGLHYAKNRYGDLRKIDPTFPGGLGYRGYDQGGWLMPNTIPVNHTRDPEPVFTSTQWESIHKLAARGANGGNFTGTLRLESGEFLGVVHGEIDRALGDVTDDMLYRGRED